LYQRLELLEGVLLLAHELLHFSGQTGLLYRPLGLTGRHLCTKAGKFRLHFGGACARKRLSCAQVHSNLASIARLCIAHGLRSYVGLGLPHSSFKLALTLTLEYTSADVTKGS
jgi:hypothetical protein